MPTRAGTSSFASRVLARTRSSTTRTNTSATALVARPRQRKSAARRAASAAKDAVRLLKRDFECCSTPLWRELLAPFDWLALRTSRIWQGDGVPRGDGSAVVTLPGFLGSDFYLRHLATWIDRVGYRHVSSGIPRNADCPDHLQQRVFDVLERAAEETGRPVHLVGHSLGGVMALSTAVQRPSLVASVTTLGSPFRGVRSHPILLRLSELVRQTIVSQTAREVPPECYTGRCTCPFFSALDRAPRVPHLAVYTKQDGVVDWQFCFTGNAAQDREVSGTHSGLVFNPEVFTLLGDFLAEARTRQRKVA